MPFDFYAPQALGDHASKNDLAVHIAHCLGRDETRPISADDLRNGWDSDTALGKLEREVLHKSDEGQRAFGAVCELARQKCTSPFGMMLLLLGEINAKRRGPQTPESIREVDSLFAHASADIEILNQRDTRAMRMRSFLSYQLDTWNQAMGRDLDKVVQNKLGDAMKAANAGDRLSEIVALDGAYRAQLSLALMTGTGVYDAFNNLIDLCLAVAKELPTSGWLEDDEARRQLLLNLVVHLLFAHVWTGCYAPNYHVIASQAMLWMSMYFGTDPQTSIANRASIMVAQASHIMDPPYANKLLNMVLEDKAGEVNDEARMTAHLLMARTMLSSHETQFSAEPHLRVIADGAHTVPHLRAVAQRMLVTRKCNCCGFTWIPAINPDGESHCCISEPADEEK